MDCVDEALGEKFCQHLLELPPAAADNWSQSTSNAQPAILASTYILYDLFRQLHGVDLVENSRASFLLGHSLGEYTALALGGVISLPEAVKVVRERGRLMEALVGSKKYAMAVLVFKPAAFEEVMSIAENHGVLACVNNSTQVLISGEPDQLKRAIDSMNSPKKTILKVANLPVTIPFHNLVLQSMENDLAALVSESKNLAKPIICNLTGKPATLGIFQNTLRSNSRPVLWKNSMEYLVEAGVTRVVNLGPGNAVDSINGRFGVENHPLKSFDDFEKLAQVLELD